MNQCYMCGRILVDKPSNDIECQKHDEHIIPNSIGGHLTSNKILCEECGGNLSIKDKNFADIFSPFIVLLQQAGILRPLDRKNNNNRSVDGEVFEDPDRMSSGERIKYKAGKAIPVKPSYSVDHSEKKVEIFGSPRIKKAYEQYVKKEMLANGKNIADYAVSFHSNLMDKGFLGLYFTKDKPNFNKDFQEGIMKIAIEMALHFGISRDDLKDIIEIDRETGHAKYKDNPLIWPYVSIAPIDIIFENQRYSIDPNYPSHVVRIFSEHNNAGTKHLLAYIELFSTFQYYVLLNNDYGGPDIDNTYAQRLIRKNVPAAEELDQLDPSELLTEISRAGIDTSDVMGLSRGEIINKIIYSRRQENYVYDLYKSLAPVLDNLMSQVLITILRSKPDKDEKLLDYSTMSYIQTFFGKSDCNIIKKIKLSIAQYQQMNFKKLLLLNEDKNISITSYPSECLKLSEEHKEIVREYCSVKLSHLQYYCMTRAGLNKVISK